MLVSINMTVVNIVHLAQKLPVNLYLCQLVVKSIQSLLLNWYSSIRSFRTHLVNSSSLLTTRTHFSQLVLILTNSYAWFWSIRSHFKIPVLEIIYIERNKETKTNGLFENPMSV